MDEPKNKTNGERFVTFKWLIATVISIILIMSGFTTFIISSITSKFESKVDKEVFSVHLTNISCMLNDSKIAAKEAKDEAVKTNQNTQEKLHQIELLILRVPGVRK